MDLETVFGYKIFLSTCQDESVYKNKTLSDAVERIYNHPAVRNTLSREQIGQALTTVGNPDLHIANLPGIERLVEWISDQLQQVAVELGLSKTGFVMPRAWTNRMFKGCEGRCHVHQYPADGVAIFYYQVPEDSANLVVIDGGVSGSEYHDYPENRKHFISPHAGQLVIHSIDTPHAVSRHNSDDPRTCFIFEFLFTD